MRIRTKIRVVGKSGAVPPPNRAPVWNVVGPAIFQTGTPSEYPFQVVDPDGDPITITSTTLPDGVTLNGAMQKLVWSGAGADENTYVNNRLTANDTHVDSLSNLFNITIQPDPTPEPDPNDAPVWLAIPTLNSFLSGTARTTVYRGYVSDPENDPMTFTIQTWTVEGANPPVPVALPYFGITFNATNCSLVYDGTAFTVSTLTLQAVITANDGTTSVASNAFNTVPTFVAPAITTASPLPTAVVNTIYTTTTPLVTLQANLGVGPPYTFGYATGSQPLPGSLSLNSTGAITGSINTNVGQPFTVTFRVTDSRGLTGDKAFSLPVSQPASQGPVWSTVPTVNFVRGTAGSYSLAPYVSDPNNDPLTLTDRDNRLNVHGLSLDSAGKRIVYSGTDPGSNQSVTNVVIRADDAQVVFPAMPEGQVRFYAKHQPFMDKYDGSQSSPNTANFTFYNTEYDRMQVYSGYWSGAFDDLYQNGYVYKDSHGIKTSDAYYNTNPEWRLVDSAGHPLRLNYSGAAGYDQFVADVGNTAYRNRWISDLGALFTANNYKGTWIDDVNMRMNFIWLNGSTPVAAIPVDPRTPGVNMTEDNWKRYLAEFMEAVRTAFPTKEIVHNIVWFIPNSLTDQYIRRQFLAANHINLERGFTDAGMVAGSGQFGFESYLALIDYIHGLGRAVIQMEYTASTTARDYALAAYLLTNTGRDMVSQDPCSGQPATCPGDGVAPGMFWNGPQGTGWNTNLGTASTGRTVITGGYRRTFSGGSVDVLGPPTRTGTVTIGGGGPGPGPGPGNWATRSTAAGVVVATNFSTYSYGNFNTGMLGTGISCGRWPQPPTMRSCFEDTSIFCSGGRSLRFDWPSVSGQGVTGDWRIMLDDWNNQFAGDHPNPARRQFTLAWRQRFSQGWIDAQITAPGGATARPKLWIINGGVPSATELTARSVNLPNPNLPYTWGLNNLSTCSETQIAISSAGGTATSRSITANHSCNCNMPMESRATISGVTHRSQMNLGNQTPPWTCESFVSGGGTRNTSGCVYITEADRWYHFKIRIFLGPAGTQLGSQESCSVNQPYNGFINSTYEFWIGREGQPSQLVHRLTGMTFMRGNRSQVDIENTDTARYGAFVLTGQSTNRDDTASFPFMQTWVDEVILSSNDVADPL